jgi:hypothetical protein
MNILFKAYFGQKKNSEEVCPKIYIGKDPDPVPDPDVFKIQIRILIRIRSKIVRIRNTAFFIYTCGESARKRPDWK